MSIKMNLEELEFKKRNGSSVVFNAVLDKSATDALNAIKTDRENAELAIKTQKENAETAIEQKKNKTLEEIPSDYTALSGKVGELTEHLTSLETGEDGTITGRLSESIANISEYSPTTYLTDVSELTFNGITINKVEDEIAINGTISALRNYDGLNGYSRVVVSSTALALTNDSGSYRVILKKKGNTDVSGVKINLTYSTVASPFARLVDDGYEFTAEQPFAVTLSIPANTNLGTLDDPTYIYFGLEKISAKDKYARLEIDKLNKKIDTTMYDLYPTGDTTVRTNDIRKVLLAKGCCRLAEGDYYIGSLSMPQGSKLVGCGNATRLIKSVYDASNPYVVRCHPYCEIESLQIVGQLDDLTPTEIGETNGISVFGTGSADSQRFKVNIHDITVINCTGAGINIEKTGYNPQGGCHVSNAFISRCGIGIHLGQYAEFHRVTGISCNENYIGILNNGGNNVIVNCDFSSNKRGIVMDNTDGTMQNSSHGTFTGCTVNHTDNNTGIAIEIINMYAGEVFNAMQIFHGGIKLKDASYIAFSNLNCGTYTPITIENGNLITFNNSIFRTVEDVPISIVNNNKVKFNNCYYRNGSEVSA